MFLTYVKSFAKMQEKNPVNFYKKKQGWESIHKKNKAKNKSTKTHKTQNLGTVWKVGDPFVTEIWDLKCGRFQFLFKEKFFTHTPNHKMQKNLSLHLTYSMCHNTRQTPHRDALFAIDLHVCSCKVYKVKKAPQEWFSRDW